MKKEADEMASFGVSGAKGTILSYPEGHFFFFRYLLCQRNQKKNHWDKNNYPSDYQSDKLFSFFEFHSLPPVFRFVFGRWLLILLLSGTRRFS